MALDLLYFNGELITETDLEVSSIDFQDRAFHYGDGIFETLRIHQGEIPTWSFHQERLQLGQDALGLPLDSFLNSWPEFVARQLAHIPAACAKLIISRGIGPRGYKAPSITHIHWWLKVTDLPHDSATFKYQPKKLTLCNHRLSRQPALAGIKHLNRLDQVIARSEWNDSEPFDEGIMRNLEGNIIECTMSNLFWLENGKIFTPDVTQEGVDGCVRRWLIQYQMNQENPVHIIQQVTLASITQADGVFICNSLMGIQAVAEISDTVIGNATEKHALDRANEMIKSLSIRFNEYYQVNKTETFNNASRMHD